MQSMLSVCPELKQNTCVANNLAFLSQGTTPLESHMQWADGFVVVYDVCDRKSFTTARRVLNRLHRMRNPFIMPVALLANKIELDHRRLVGVDEGHELALEFACQFYEVSAAETPLAVNVAYQALLRDARITQQQRSNILSRRRSSLLTVSKKLGSIFGKKDAEKRTSRDALPDFALSI
ncbi:RERGL-like protein [Mya arenaria]|uniref:small monomeric GTPase n=1 Tax=Mya arenaria TaxID=6604 RepID=A0ABY7FHN2_MYAAR|nr:RERGL-like protein [Mya arenaria]